MDIHVHVPDVQHKPIETDANSLKMPNKYVSFLDISDYT